MSFTIKPAVGMDFIDREQELTDILETLKDPSSTFGFALYGKRRVGKTSIFKEVERQLLKEKECVPIYLSLWDLVEKNLKEFARELGMVTIEAFRPHLPLEYKAKELFEIPITMLKKIISRLKLSIELQDSIGFVFSFEKERKIDPGMLLDEVFTLPERLALTTKKKAVLFLDEFPDIMDLKLNGKKAGESIIKKIRTIHEDFKHTSLNISGSIRKTMQKAALSSTSAFYRQFIVKELLPFRLPEVKFLLKKNLEKKRLTNDGLEKLYAFTVGIPFYVQFIGRSLDRLPKKILGAKEVKYAIEDFLSQEGNLILKEEFNRLSDKERSIVVTMATKNLCTYAEISKELTHLTNAGRFLVYLEEKDVIRKEKRGVYSFADPIFKLWLSKKYQA